MPGKDDAPGQVRKGMTEEERRAAHESGKTPNSGKMRPDGTPVPGQTPEADARRAEERRLEREAEQNPQPDPNAPPA